VRTAPRVPTGMNTGVSIAPCSVVTRPSRARDPIAVLTSSNTTAACTTRLLERESRLRR
jgi:hypothetical protein